MNAAACCRRAATESYDVTACTLHQPMVSDASGFPRTRPVFRLLCGRLGGLPKIELLSGFFTLQPDDPNLFQEHRTFTYDAIAIFTIGMPSFKR